jgi:serine/threonine protein phosphatase PrpC
MSAFQPNNTRLDVKIGHATDHGGSTNAENQDISIIIPIVEHNGCLIAIADGHGSTGKFVAEVIKLVMEELIKDKIALLVENAVAFLEFAYDHIHEQIRDRLSEKLTNEGYESTVDENGVILMRKDIHADFTVLKGGSTFSIVLILEKKMYIANVGDSTGLLCCKHPILKNSLFNYEKDAADPTKSVYYDPSHDKPSNFIELTCDHSPENITEYLRMRNFKKFEENHNHAEVLCVYDKPGKYKPYCKQIFDISEEGIVTVAPVETAPIDGKFEYYYKNVREEKATYVCDRRGEYVISATRALGDFKLGSHGVSNKPEIRSINLDAVFTDLKGHIDNVSTEETVSTTEETVYTTVVNPTTVIKKALDPKTICVVLASDGLWDNFKYQEVQLFVMDNGCLKAIVDKPMNGAQLVVNSLMNRNATRGAKNFKEDRDNATTIVMYITEENK